MRVSHSVFHMNIQNLFVIRTWKSWLTIGFCLFGGKKEFLDFVTWILQLIVFITISWKNMCPELTVQQHCNRGNEYEVCIIVLWHNSLISNANGFLSVTKGTLDWKNPSILTEMRERKNVFYHCFTLIVLGQFRLKKFST